MQNRRRFTNQASIYHSEFQTRKVENNAPVFFVDGKYVCNVHKTHSPPPGYKWDRGTKGSKDSRTYTALEKVA